MSAYHHFLVVFLFLVLMCVYRTTKHQVRRYIVLYIDGKNAYDAVCRIILKRYKPVRAQWVLSFASFCVGEKRREKKKKRDNTKKRERETKIYVYIQAICLSDSGSPSAKGNKTDLCSITVCLCAEKILFW